jgi:hypothetical protein
MATPGAKIASPLRRNMPFANFVRNSSMHDPGALTLNGQID